MHAQKLSNRKSLEHMKKYILIEVRSSLHHNVKIFGNVNEV